MNIYDEIKQDIPKKCDGKCDGCSCKKIDWDYIESECGFSIETLSEEVARLSVKEYIGWLTETLNDAGYTLTITKNEK